MSIRAVRIQTPARIHCGFFALAGGMRQFGGIGFGIDSPGYDLTVRVAAVDRVEASADLQPRIRAGLERARQFAALPPLEIIVDAEIPAHVGLGSGTQLAMAIADGCAQIAGEAPEKWSISEWVRRTGRGRRSSIGIFAYLGHEFIVESGHGPTGEPSELIGQYSWPAEWRVLLARLPLPIGLHGSAELQALEKDLTIPAEVSAQLCQSACLEILPALEAGDYPSFGKAIGKFNRLVGQCYIPVQPGPFAHPQIEQLIEHATRMGFPAACQSSWGPTVACIVPTETAGLELATALQAVFPGLETSLTCLGFGASVTDIGRVDLLVSVKNRGEAELALASGAGIIDIKDPERGALGRAETEVAGEIVTYLSQTKNPPRLVTIALGDLAELEEAETPLEIAAADFYKIGFLNEADRIDWIRRFVALPAKLAHPSGSPISLAQMIPVAYADYSLANAPSLSAVFDLACHLPSRWLLIDTYEKTSTVWDWLKLPELCRIAEQAAQKGLQLALAGSLKLEDIVRLGKVMPTLPTVFAVRGAACSERIRSAPLEAGRVRELAAAVRNASCRLRLPTNAGD